MQWVLTQPCWEDPSVRWVLTQLCQEDPPCHGCSPSCAGRTLCVMGAQPAMLGGPSMRWVLSQPCWEDPPSHEWSPSCAGRTLCVMGAHPAMPGEHHHMMGAHPAVPAGPHHAMGAQPAMLGGSSMPWLLTQLCRKDPPGDGCSASHAGRTPPCNGCPPSHARRTLHAMGAHPAMSPLPAAAPLQGFIPTCAAPVSLPDPWAGASPWTVPQCFLDPSPDPILPLLLNSSFASRQPATRRRRRGLGAEPCVLPHPGERPQPRGGCCPLRCCLKAGGEGAGRAPQPGSGHRSRGRA